jgi:hypothetical protein
VVTQLIQVLLRSGGKVTILRIVATLDERFSCCHRRLSRTFLPGRRSGQQDRLILTQRDAYRVLLVGGTE